jgi:hypothetical protein
LVLIVFLHWQVNLTFGSDSSSTQDLMAVPHDSVFIQLWVYTGISILLNVTVIVPWLDRQSLVSEYAACTTWRWGWP